MVVSVCSCVCKRVSIRVDRVIDVCMCPVSHTPRGCAGAHIDDGRRRDYPVLI